MTRQVQISRSGDRSTGHCHKAIREVAMQAAERLYDQVMKDNLVYAAWKKQHPNLRGDKALRAAFVRKAWGRCVPFARATLAQMLTTGLDNQAKESIMEVLILDNTLRRGRPAQGGPNLIRPLE